MTKPEVIKGSVVRSLAGRDQGRLFVVVDVLDDPYVLLVDGGLRKLERPKKKKRKHLRVVSEPISAIVHGTSVADHEIRSALTAIASKEEG